MTHTADGVVVVVSSEHMLPVTVRSPSARTAIRAARCILSEHRRRLVAAVDDVDRELADMEARE